MENENKVYSIMFTGNLIPGALANIFFEINNAHRTAKLKNVFFDLHLQDPTPPTFVLPLEQNTVINYVFTMINLPAGIPFAQSFDNIVVPALTTVINGEEAYFFKVGTTKFNSFFIRNALQFRLTIQNLDLLQIYEYYASVIVEIEEL